MLEELDGTRSVVLGDIDSDDEHIDLVVGNFGYEYPIEFLHSTMASGIP